MTKVWYQKIYNQIIDKRKKEIPDGYVERHHIIPKSLGGSNNKENLVFLTAKEHYVCHHLLMKIYYDPKHYTNDYYKTCYAFDAMSKLSNNGLRKMHINARSFAYLKAELTKCISLYRTKENSPLYGKIAIYNKKLNLVQYISKNTDIPNGWVKGGKPMEKIVWIGKHHTEKTKQKMSESHQLNKHQLGSKNSQYGKKWMFNLELKQCRSVFEEDFEKLLSEGWQFGRKMKF